MADTKKTDEETKITPKKIDTEKEVTALALQESEKNEIEKTFKEANSFRTVGEKITEPLNSIVSEAAKVIDKDPIMSVSDELGKMNSSVQEVYDDIITGDGKIMRTIKSIPLIGNLAKALDKNVDNAKFNLASVEKKIEIIFSGFDTTYGSVTTSIGLQENFLDGIEEHLGKVVAYKDFIDAKIVEFKTQIEEAKDEETKEKYEMFLRNVEYFQGNLVVLIGNLQMARKRLLIRLDSANKLSLAMNSSRPIFKTLLSTAIIESSSQKAIDASIKAINVMGETIDKMSQDLTEKAIESSKKTEEITSKPVLSQQIFRENVEKLKNHFAEIETYRKEMKAAAEQERQEFAKATKELEEIKVLNRQDSVEFAKAIEGFEPKEEKSEDKQS